MASIAKMFLIIVSMTLIIGIPFAFAGCENKDELKAAGRQHHVEYIKDNLVMQDVEFGGHMYVVATTRTRYDTLSFIHHPACPCRPF